MRVFITFFSCLFALTINAQSTIELEQDYVSRTYTNVDISDDNEKFPLNLYFKNNTNGPISVNWRREFGNNCPLTWDIFTSDEIISYLPHVNESQQAIPLMQGDSNILVRQIFYPRTVSGCCDIKMIFSLDGAPDNPIDTGYYQIEINAAGCLSSSLIQEGRNEFKVYPNPTTGTLNFEGINDLESIAIFDLYGKVYYQNNIVDSRSIDISSLISGIYLCKFKSGSGDYLVKKVLVY